MKRIFSTFLLYASSITLLHASIQSGADKLINQVDPHINIGIEIVDLTTDTTLYQRNQDRSFIPASNMKLFSDAAALMALGPDYRFKNDLSTVSTELANGVLKGSLYLNLSGDPSFNRERLAALINSLREWHINRIKGNVVIESSHAVVNPYAPGWMIEDLAYSYGAPLAPLMIDANRTLVTVNPADRPGQAAVVEVSDKSGSIIVNNQAITKGKGARCGVELVMDKENHLTVRGCVSVGQWAVQEKMAIRNPLLYAQGLIKQQLAQENIILEGNVILGKTPPGAMLLATDTSKPIAQLMADTLKPSDNLYADSLFLHAADKLHGSPVSWEEAQPVIKNFLEQQTGIALRQANLTDGSGLSRYDLLTPHQTVSLLHFLYGRFPLTYEYIAALPVSGRDGTLQRRFKKPEQQDRVRAKTGTMTGVVSLSGYLSTANGHTLAFAIFINNVPGTKLAVSGRYRYLVDALCNYFLKQEPVNVAWKKSLALLKRIKFQLNPTQAEQQRHHQAKWRFLETLVKQALQGQAVTVLFRGNELVLNDKQKDAGKVMAALQRLRKKYLFAIALFSKSMPFKNNQPFVLWIESPIQSTQAQRIWTIREAIS